MFRKLRILILLLILATVALETWRANRRLTAWEQTVHVAVFPLAGDDSPATARYLEALRSEDFAEIGEWMQEEVRGYGQSVLQPVGIELGPRVSELPPAVPPAAQALDVIVWSLKLRWWASHHDAIAGPRPNVRMFVLFHYPALTSVLPHSTGLEKGQIAIVHAFASARQQRQNNVVIAHEMLHTFGATDKYDLQTTLPRYPEGYAEPERQPRWPQAFAEIMGGRIPLAADKAEMPRGLNETVIGPETAREIGLLPLKP